MGRPQRVWVWRARKQFYVTLDGNQVPLGVPGPDTPERRALAEAALARLLGGNVATTVAEAVAAFLDHAALRNRAGKLSKGCLRNYRVALGPFALEFGSRSLLELRSPEGRLCVEAWCAGRGWSGSYQNDVLGVIQAVFKRAGVAVRFDRPPKESRGSDVALTDEQFARVLGALYLKGGQARGDLAELLTLLRETGRRPAEACGLTVEGIDWPNCCKLAREHKTKKRTGRDALWVFNSAAMAVLRRQRDRYGSGLLFRTRGGRKAYQPNVIVKQLLKVSRRVGFRVIAYGLGRHSFATTALERGVPEAMVAALLGHTSTAMVAKHYGHLGSRADAMRAAAERVSGK